MTLSSTTDMTTTNVLPDGQQTPAHTAMTPITHRVTAPTPDQVRAARKPLGLSQSDAARLVSPAQKSPYRSWQSYEVATGSPGSRAIPLATWELFLLLTDQHPSLRLAKR
jgi:hypothetical protein